MELSDLPLFDPRDALRVERNDLLALLDGLAEVEWVAPTDAGHWRVKDVALHLLDDDLGWLSRGRDGDMTGLLPTDGDYREFVRSLDAKNERWVVGAVGLSRRVVVDLLRWTAGEVHEYHASLDLEGPSGVIWASGGTVPRWFDLCRDLTERWVHQQHIRDAVGQPGEHDRFLPEVLGTFVWAFPHQYEAEAPTGTTVQIGLGTGGTWHLVRSSDCWKLQPGPASYPAATLNLHETDAWRQLTGLQVAEDAISTDGPDQLVHPLLRVRGIIA
jgi:Mycothiol maleylpyruvate isomerase N-terminal domain